MIRMAKYEVYVKIYSRVFVDAENEFEAQQKVWLMNVDEVYKNMDTLRVVVVEGVRERGDENE